MQPTPPAVGQQPPAAAPSSALVAKWEYKLGALQYAEQGGVKNVFFVELPVGGAEVKIAKLSELTGAGWEYAGPANVYDVMVFDREKLMPATVLRRPL